MLHSSTYLMPEKVTELILNSPIEILSLSNRSYRCLAEAGIFTVKELCNLTEDDLFKISSLFKSLGRKTFEELEEKLSEYGLFLSDAKKKPQKFERHATKFDWKREELPQISVSFSIEFPLNDNQIKTLKQGVVPKSMSEKWFIYYENEHLHFYRSWSGKCYFIVKLAKENHAVTAYVYDENHLENVLAHAKQEIHSLLTIFSEKRNYL